MKRRRGKAPQLIRHKIPVCLVPWGWQLPYGFLFFQDPQALINLLLCTTNPVSCNRKDFTDETILTSNFLWDFQGGCRETLWVCCHAWPAAESKGPAAPALLTLIYRTCPVMQMLFGSLRKCQLENNSCSLPTDTNLNRSIYNISKFRNLHRFLTLKVHFLFTDSCFKHSHLVHLVQHV